MIPLLQFALFMTIFIGFVFIHYWMIKEGENVKKQQRDDYYKDGFS